MTDHITRDNLLANIHSLGCQLVQYANPGFYAFEDRVLAKGYQPKVAAARRAYAAIRDGADMCATLAQLQQDLVTGVECNRCRLLQAALDGKYAKTADQLANLDKGFYWVTYNGDFYGVNTGDCLNLPRVDRRANRNVPPEYQDTTGAQAIADMLPNPCTRVRRSVQVR